MKAFVLVFALMVSVALGAQTLTLPPASTATAPGVPLSWTAATNCGTGCTYNLYEIGGACPATLAGTAGWKLVNTAPIVALEVTDNSETSGTEVAYVVEAVGSDGLNSGPSNCVSTTVPAFPLVPSPPVLSGN